MHRRFEPSVLRRIRRALVGCAAWAALCGAPPLHAQLPAPPVVGDGPLQLGGWAALTLSRPEHPEEVERPEVSELVAALIGWGQVSRRASYLVELDMAKRTTSTWTGREADAWLSPVRLYVELSARESLRLRVGRFLTPVGQWNELHADPLTWSPTRPLTTYRPFAKSTTGVLLAGEGVIAGRDWGWATFWAPGVDLDGDLEEDEENTFARAAGGRVAMEVSPGLTVGGSIARLRRSLPPEEDAGGGPQWSTRADALRRDDPEREEEAEGRTLVGADLRWESARAQLALEGTWLRAAAEEVAEGGAFARLAVRIGGPLWAVARVESYRPIDGRTADVGYVGLTARPDRRLVVKLGRQFTRRPSTRIPDGWFLSFSSLF